MQNEEAEGNPGWAASQGFEFRKAWGQTVGRQSVDNRLVDLDYRKENAVGQKRLLSAVAVIDRATLANA